MAKLTEEELLFRKVEEKVKKAIFEYGLIVDGDRILIGLSGGKDSLALVDLLGRRSKIFRPRFEGDRDAYRDVKYPLSFGY